MGAQTPLTKTIGKTIRSLAGLSPSDLTSMHHYLQISWLLDQGLDLEAQDMQGDTALHYAVFYTQRAVVLLLLSRGAQIAARNKEVSCFLFSDIWQGYVPSCTRRATQSGDGSEDASAECHPQHSGW